MAESLFETLRRQSAGACYQFARRTKTCTYSAKDLFERAANIAAVLRQQGWPRGARVGFMLRTQEQQTLFYLAALCADLSPAILTPSHARLSRGVFEESLTTVMKTSFLNAIVADCSLPSLVSEEVATPSGAVFVTALRVAEGPQSQCLLQFSSGTTGLKKCVEIPLSALRAQLRVYGRAIAIETRDHILSWLPLYHDMGFIACLNLPLFHGASATFIETLDWLLEPRLFFKLAHENAATLSWNPNFFFAFMAARLSDVDLNGLSLATLRGLINCSEPVTARAQELFRRRFAPLGLRANVFCGCYAMAETAFALTHIREDDPGYADERGLSVGAPLPGVRLEIRNEAGALASDGEVGEIHVTSPFNFAGYLGRAAGAAWVEAFRTGDLGYRCGDHYFVVGRLNDRVAINGEKFYAHEIEECVGGVDGVAGGRVCAFGVFDEQCQSERLVVLAEPDADVTLDSSLIRAAVAQNYNITALEFVEVPRGTLLKSSSGKISRSRCRAWWEGRVAAPAPAVLAATDKA
jgi:acyl-CoA synthetase (AMP-forming)/AMP-acid ligase II